MAIRGQFRQKGMVLNNRGETMTEEYHTPHELAQTFRVHEKTLTRWVERGEFPKPLRCLGTTRYPASAVAEWVDQHTPQGDTEQ
jgi:predicted DNA-binding transcriptional regulator AlpA